MTWLIKADSTEPKGRYVHKPGYSYLWDTQENHFTGFNSLDGKGQPIFVNNPKVLPPTEEMAPPSKKLNVDSEEYEHLNALVRAIVDGGVSMKEIDPLIRSVAPFKTVADVEALSVKLWQLAQEHGLSREWLLEKVSSLN